MNFSLVVANTAVLLKSYNFVILHLTHSKKMLAKVLNTCFSLETAEQLRTMRDDGWRESISQYLFILTDQSDVQDNKNVFLLLDHDTYNY